MTISYFVEYRGTAENQIDFVNYYQQSHVPIIKRFTGIQNVKIHTPISVIDPLPATNPEIALIAQLEFFDIESLTKALQSDTRLRAREDMKNFPAFDGQIFHHAMMTQSFPGKSSGELS